MNVCPDCSSVHLGRCGGLTFRQRLLSVRLGEGTRDTATKTAYYDTEVTEAQFGMNRKDRIEDYWDSTHGYGHGETQPDGSVIAHDPKTREKRVLTPTEVERAYLGGEG